MAYQKTIWKNREVEKPRTFNIQNNPDGTVTLLPAEGNIIEAGTPIVAENMNKIEDAIASHLDESATTTTKGHVQLSNDTNSTSQTLAPTMKALNEVKQYANDIKSKWANVVGSPLAASDTQAQLQTKTQTIKNALATNLTAKGQTSVGTETLTALVNKVPNINTGKNTAAGTGTTDSTGKLTVNGLGFRPRNVIVQRLGFPANTVIYSEDAYAYASTPINKFAQNGALDIYNIVTVNSSGFTATMQYLSNTNVTYFASE